jgi:hypothetical protein
MFNLFSRHVADAVVSQCKGSCNTGLPTIGANGGNLQVISQWAIGAVAAIAVLILVIAGFRLIFAARSGDANAAARLRGTIVYAGIGLVTAIIADGIVTFVLNKV